MRSWRSGRAGVTRPESWSRRDVKAGDQILFGKWSGTEVKIDGEELLIMKESDVMGIVEAEPNGIAATSSLNPGIGAVAVPVGAF